MVVVCGEVRGRGLEEDWKGKREGSETKEVPISRISNIHR